VQVFGELLGVPEQDRLELSTLMPLVLAAMHPGATEEHLNQADEVNRKIESYFVELAEERRRNPRNDLISAWVTLYDDDPDILSADELMSMAWGLWAGGFTTTATAIDHGVLTMLRAEPPIYHTDAPLHHGDPTQPSPSVLVYTIFGLEMLVRLREIGFATSLYQLYVPSRGILGPNAIVFEAIKLP